ncbi:hypothetical protein [Halorussus pelagicus]|uniref:hypothetical protein n=1 Tax=Halorussus pelagicus TaxID=2505977 RepID=UPI0014098A45|nr:hypothetical protein [Halorussus pelagicus]
MKLYAQLRGGRIAAGLTRLTLPVLLVAWAAPIRATFALPLVVVRAVVALLKR